MNDCPKAADRDLVSRYLAGKLGEDEAAAFEKHFSACETCRIDVETRRPSLRMWLPLATAAAIAVVGVGVWQVVLRSPEGPSVSRGAIAGIEGLAISPSVGGGLDVAWTPRSDAAVYDVQVFGPDGRRLWRAETAEPRVRIESSLLLPPLRRTCNVRVEALGARGQVVASGESALEPQP